MDSIIECISMGFGVSCILCLSGYFVHLIFDVLRGV